MNFLLGVHEPAWLAHSHVPLFVSHRRLARRVRQPRARTTWALDSGGFSELSLHGGWETAPESYIEATRRYREDIGRLAWAAPMDWMCEPFIVAKTGLSVDRHQALTVENVSLLREHAPDVPWIPVLQGWTLDDYVACIGRYYAAGIDLSAEALVGVGSVCRRQGSGDIAEIFRELRLAGLRCHGFGVKTQGLMQYGDDLTSADSMAWSLDARRNPALPGCKHRTCQNCWRYAIGWRDGLMRQLASQEQGQ